MSHLFDEFNDHLPDVSRALYRASLARDEQEAIRLLDAHLAAHGEPEQVRYADLHRQDDPDLGRFPYHCNAHR